MITVLFLAVLYTFTAGVLLLLAMFCLEVLFAVMPWRETTQVEPLSRLRFAVLIPAHNEQTSLGPTLQTLVPTLGPKDWILVVADNCTDSTASIARHAGAEVIELRDPSRRGRGGAIDFGLKHLQSDPPDGVIFLDGDCAVLPETVRMLGTAAVTMRRPAQGMNLCDPEGEEGPTNTMSKLAFRFRHLVRAIGLSRLAGLCYLSGTGMALPWSLTYNLRLDGDNQVEDRQLGLDLAVGGSPPLLVPQARVDSPLPHQEEAARAQHTRWEHGYLRTLLTQVPRLFCQGASNGRPDVMAMSLDLAIPPMSVLAAIWFVAMIAALIGIPLGATAWPALFLLFGAQCSILALAAGWLFYCRKAIPFSALCALPFYIASQLPAYFQFGRKPQEAWVRTGREVASSQAAMGRSRRA